MEWVSNGFAVLEALALITGIVLAIVSWRRQPGVALFAVLGLAALLVTYAAWLLEVVIFPHLAPGQYSTVAVITSVISTVGRLTGLVLLMLALVRRGRDNAREVRR